MFDEIRPESITPGGSIVVWSGLKVIHPAGKHHSRWWYSGLEWFGGDPYKIRR